jgi:hypothetical protein
MLKMGKDLHRIVTLLSLCLFICCASYTLETAKGAGKNMDMQAGLSAGLTDSAQSITGFIPDPAGRTRSPSSLRRGIVRPKRSPPTLKGKRGLDHWTRSSRKRRQQTCGEYLQCVCWKYNAECYGRGNKTVTYIPKFPSWVQELSMTAFNMTLMRPNFFVNVSQITSLVLEECGISLVQKKCFMD